MTATGAAAPTEAATHPLTETSAPALEPVARPVHRDVEPIDLVAVAGPALAKRAAGAGLVAVGLLVLYRVARCPRARRHARRSDRTSAGPPGAHAP
jgi:hypothetical protein